MKKRNKLLEESIKVKRELDYCCQTLCSRKIILDYINKLEAIIDEVIE